MTAQNPDWTVLQDRYAAELVGALKGYFIRGGDLEITARQLAIRADSKEHVAKDLLEDVAKTGALDIEQKFVCPCEKKCDLTEAQAHEALCASCKLAFDADVPGKPTGVAIYSRHAPKTRDVEWMLVLHGMNTAGAWQESFNWLSARIYGRSVPVAIYKYGIVRPGAILKCRQHALMRQLQNKIRHLAKEASASGFGGKPDVIAHSFGTWLLGHALENDRDLKVGRVILTGCILRPDFDWDKLFRRKQVEAVLCHTASKDRWAAVAHYIIPDSGPSGRRGFNDKGRVGHVILGGGRHSDFFLDKQMPCLLNNVWQPFLTEPENGDDQQVRKAAKLPDGQWHPARWPFRATLLRLAVLTTFVGIAIAAVVALALGSIDLFHWLRTMQFS